MLSDVIVEGKNEAKSYTRFIRWSPSLTTKVALPITSITRAIDDINSILQSKARHRDLRNHQRLIRGIR